MNVWHLMSENIIITASLAMLLSATIVAGLGSRPVASRLGSADSVYAIDTAPLDRVIEVRLIEEQQWICARWDAGAQWFEVVGEDTWVLPMELDLWRAATPIAAAP